MTWLSSYCACVAPVALPAGRRPSRREYFTVASGTPVALDSSEIARRCLPRLSVAARLGMAIAMVFAMVFAGVSQLLQLVHPLLVRRCRGLE